MVTATEESTSIGTAGQKSRSEVFIEELIVDVLVTIAIVWFVVWLGEPLLHVLRSPLFITLTLGGLAHLTYKAVCHNPSGSS